MSGCWGRVSTCGAVKLSEELLSFSNNNNNHEHLRLVIALNQQINPTPSSEYRYPVHNNPYPQNENFPLKSNPVGTHAY
jgi:hypothetical protein